MRCFAACQAGWIPAECTSSCMGRRLSYSTENIYETYCCIQILKISAADFIGWTATPGSASPSVSYDLNIYGVPDDSLMVRHYGKLQSFETSLSRWKQGTAPTTSR